MNENMNPFQKKRQEIREIAKQRFYREGELEIHDDAQVSGSDDSGAHVQAWVWVDFTGTKFDNKPVGKSPLRK